MLSLLARTLALGLALAAILTLTATTRADVDLWGHLRFGLDILESRSLESVDPYSFTSDRPWINHEWLAEIAIALTWRTAGSPGLILLKLACTFAALALVASALKAQGITGRAQVMMLGLTLVGILPRVTHVRPQLFSVVLFALLMRVLTVTARPGRSAGASGTRATANETGDEMLPGRARPSGEDALPSAISSPSFLWTIPILALWANLHGGWLVGVGTVCLWSLGEAWARRSEPLRAAAPLGCAAAATAATLLNPYGSGLWTFLFETVRFGREAISEWGPAWSTRTTMIVWSCFAVLAVVAVRRLSSRDGRPLTIGWRRNPAALLIPILWGIAALRVNRLDAFFALSVIVLMAKPIASLFARPRSREPLPFAWKAAGAVFALIVMVATPVSRAAVTCIGIHSTWPEPQAVEFAHQRRLSGNVVTFFDWGEYAIWNMPSAIKVSMDGRRETVYSDRTIDRHLQLYLGEERGLAYLEELRPHFVWLPRMLPVVRTLQDRAWVRLFEGPRSTLLGAPWLAGDFVGPALVVGGEPAGRCFPGP